MTREITLTLDEETIQRIELAAEHLGKSNSEVVDDAIANYRELPDRMTETERQRMLKALEKIRNQPPSRPQEEVERELKELRLARHGGVELQIDDSD
jgi:predicted DNA-binding protein